MTMPSRDRRSTRTARPGRTRRGAWLLAAVLMLLSAPVLAATYTSAPMAFNWISPTGHTPVTWSGTSQCSGGGAPTDDDITAPIPLGFTFNFGGVNYTTVRIMSNGRLQFNNNFCGYGTQRINPRTYPYPIPNNRLLRTMRVYGNDLDPALGGSVTYATLGTAPNREFVVTFTNVPEWGANGSYFNLQVILYENGTFAYQFGPSNNPSGGHAQIGWELTTSDYGLVSYSTIGALNGTALLFTRTVVTPLAYYRMDAASWNGTAGEVIDSSGNGNNGTGIGRANTVYPGEVCRGGNIPGNRSASQQNAVATPIDPGTQIGPAGTIEFWYQSNKNWSNKNNRMLFDASQAGTGDYFFLDLRDQGKLYFGFDDSTGRGFHIETARYNFSTTNKIKTVPWVHIAVTWDLGAGTMQIYVNGSLAVSGSTAGSSGAFGALNTLYLGDNRSSFIQSMATGGSADGVLDEARIYRQVLTRAQILYDMNATHGCTALDHFAISVGAGTASTCTPLAVTITAEDAANNVLTGYGGLVDLSDSAGHGDWSVNAANGTLTPGAADSGSATYQFVPTDSGTVTLNLADAHADDLTVTVADPTAGVTSTSGTVSFRDNAFVITSTDALGTQVVAGRPQGFNAALWRKDPTTGVCAIATQYSGAKALKAWYTPDVSDPAGARPPAIGAATLPAAVPGANNVTLTFTSGQAPFTLNTTDVGKFTLALRDDTSAFAKTVTGGARAIDGTGPTLTVRPFALALVNVLAGTTPNPGATTAGGAVFTGAGDPFAATVRGVLWQAADDPTNSGSPAPGANLADNPVTPSFAWPTTLGAGAPYQPSGGVLGALTLAGSAPATLPASAYSNGAATATPLTYSEVGAFTLGAQATNYLNTAGVNVGGSAVVGRFIPAWLQTVVTPGCGTAFTYSGQPFTVTSTAYNAFGAVTRNYDGTLGFAKTTTFSDAGPGGGGTLSNALLSGLDYVQGVGTDSTITYTFTNADTAPYNLTVRATDTDGASSTGHTEGSTEVRSGRVFLQNAFGSELLALQMPLAIQYYQSTGTGWSTNAADTCTSLTTSDFSLGNWTGALGPGDTSITGVTLSAGSGALTLSAPGAGKVGSVDVTGNVPAWLRYDWNPTGGVSNPVGRASFGVFKGPGSVIYQRELY